jgi:hypothetical protein
MMAAYLTYLRGFLTVDQQEDLDVDAADCAENLPCTEAVGLVAAEYAQRVKARRPRPAVARPGVLIEDLPVKWAYLDDLSHWGTCKKCDRRYRPINPADICYGCTQGVST